MSLQNLIERKLVDCRPDSTIKEVAQLMDSEDVGAILVCDEQKKPVGIVTDRDIVIRCVVQGSDCTHGRVRDIMTTDVATVDIDNGIFDVIQKMRDNQIRRIPVVDRDGKACGLLSFGDIFQLLGREMADLAQPVTPDQPKLVDKKQKVA